MIKNKKKINKSKLWSVALVILCISLYVFGQKLTRENNELRDQLTSQSIELFELRDEHNDLFRRHEFLEDTLRQNELEKNK